MSVVAYFSQWTPSQLSKEENFEVLCMIQLYCMSVLTGYYCHGSLWPTRLIHSCQKWIIFKVSCLIQFDSMSVFIANYCHRSLWPTRFIHSFSKVKIFKFHAWSSLIPCSLFISAIEVCGPLNSFTALKRGSFEVSCLVQFCSLPVWLFISYISLWPTELIHSFQKRTF